MKKLYLPFLVLLAVAACSKEKNDETPDEKPDPVKTEAPKVVSTTPAANATDVELLEEVVISYDKDIELVSKPTININGEYFDDMAYTVEKDLFIPVKLESGKSYRIKVLKPSVKDDEGNFAEDFEFSFTTRSGNNFNAAAWTIADAPVDAAASTAAKTLYAEVKADFGTKIRSGVWGDPTEADAMKQAGGATPAIGVFETGDIAQFDLLTSWSGAIAASWHWYVPVEDPNGSEPQPDPEMEGDVIYDFDNVVCGNWEAFQYLDNSYFTQCSVGTLFTVYYNDAAEWAQMALKSNIEGWPGIVDANGNNYEFFDIEPGAGSFSLEVDAEVLKVMLGAGVIIGGHDYTITGVSLSFPAPGPQPEYTEEEIAFDEVACGGWAAYKYLDNSYFGNCKVGTRFVVHYKDAAGAQMAFKSNVEGWPGIVDGNGRDYSYFNIQDGEGDYTLKVDEIVLGVLQGPGIIIGGHDYTIAGVTLYHPSGSGVVEYDEETIEIGKATGNWADYQYLEPATFIGCSIGSQLVVNYSDAAEGAQMALKTNSAGWPGIVDDNGTNYEYFNIQAGSGKYTLDVDAEVLTQLRATGLIIGGHDYTIVSLVIRNPKAGVAAAAPKPRKDVEYSYLAEGNAFTPAAALTEGTWQNDYLQLSVSAMTARLLQWQASGKALLFCPIPAASDGTKWWSNGTPADYIALWKYIYDAFTQAGVHNLLWVWTSCGNDAAWYPGDEYVDFVAGLWAPDQEALFHTSGLTVWNHLNGITAHKMPVVYGTSLPSVAACLEDGTLWSAAVLKGSAVGDNGADFLKDWMASETVVNAR